MRGARISARPVHCQRSKEGRGRGVPEVVGEELQASRDEHWIDKPAELDKRRDSRQFGNRDGRRSQHHGGHARKGSRVERFAGD